MRKRVKILGVLLMIVMVSSFATALQKPVLQQAGTSTQLVISGQDVITASDAGEARSPQEISSSSSSLLWGLPPWASSPFSLSVSGGTFLAEDLTGSHSLD